MIKNPKHWANNCAGIFLIAATMFVVVIAVSRHFPSSGTSFVLWLLGLIGVAALAGWTALATIAGGKSAERVLFRR